MVQASKHSPAGPRSRASQGPEAPAFDPASVEPPSWLSGEALKAWGRALVLMTGARTAAEADLTSLARYCQFLSEWIDLTEAIMRDGHTREDRFGSPKLNPAVSARDGIERSLRALEKALGLDPSSYLALTKDLASQARERAKVRGTGQRRVGGFLNKPDPKAG